MYDVIIKGGEVVDGTGAARRRADVGIRDGKVVAIGEVTGEAATTIDATGKVAAPGFVDVHTHFDAQVFWDGALTPSPLHGVTTVLAGNCGFSVAPVKPADRDFLQGIFAAVENMDPIALSAITWDEFETFKEFVETRKGRLGVNFATYIGHSNLRRWVMGEDATSREATADEVAEMRRMVREAMEAGASGLSSSAAPTHLDIHGVPVPSRFSNHDELRQLAEEVGLSGGGSIGYLPQSAIGGIDAADEDYMIELGQASGLPVIIQGLGGRNKTDAPSAAWPKAVEFLDKAVAQGAPVYSMLIARPFDRPVIFNPTNFHYPAVPSWHRLMTMSNDERRAILNDPAEREEMRFAVENYNRDPAKGTTLSPPLWNALYVDAVALDNRFEPVVREDGSMSQTAEGSPVRRFALLGSTKGLEGPYATLIEGEAKADAQTVVKLPKPATARWLRLRVDSNWAGSGQTRLSDLAILGTLDQRGGAAIADASGVYAHEYGPILLRQKGNEVFGCYNDGLGTLRGTVFGRIMRLAWYSKAEGSIGAATLVAANGKLYGFWYRPEDKMGSPWNAVRESGLAGADLGKCRAALYPSS